MTTSVHIKIEGWPPRQWHVALAERLERALAAEVTFAAGVAAGAEAQRYIERVLRLDRLLEHADQRWLVPVGRSPQEGPAPDVVVDLSAADPVDGVWQVLFDGRPGSSAAAMALARGRFPTVTVLDPEGCTRVTGRPGSEQPGFLSVALPDVLAGTGTLLASALTGHTLSAPLRDDDEVADPMREPMHKVVLGRVAKKALYTGYRLATRSPHWRVGWRAADGGLTAADLTAAVAAEWTDLPDDGYHFYADPFLVERDGQEYLFVEDFDHRVGRGEISVVEMDDDGPRGTPRVVLRHEVHLSYPFVLEHEGEVWMIPETSAANRIEIYRATRFPDAWERAAVIVEDVPASDATPFEHDGRWWMFATVRHGGSYSDHLHLWSASDLLGPWSPHRGNPLLVDIASARPAGHVIHQDGRLLRPTQDCRAGYGAALNIMEVTRLDHQHFEQRLLTPVAPDRGWPGRRLHTLNRSGRFDVIDGSRIAPRLALRGRA